jgi:hypothetical protein
MDDVRVRVAENLRWRMWRAPIYCIVAGIIPPAAVALSFGLGTPRYDDLIFSVAILSMIAVAAWGLVFRDKYIVWRDTGWRLSIRALLIVTAVIAAAMGLVLWTAGWSAATRSGAMLVASALGLVVWAGRCEPGEGVTHTHNLN